MFYFPKCTVERNDIYQPFYGHMNNFWKKKKCIGQYQIMNNTRMSTDCPEYQEDVISLLAHAMASYDWEYSKKKKLTETIWTLSKCIHLKIKLTDIILENILL